MANKPKTVFICGECGAQSSKWLGKCPTCGSWNSFTEETLEEQPAAPVKRKALLAGDDTPEPLSELDLPDYMRSPSGSAELDRVLGGGLVHGSVVLVAGEPGIGKSTMLMQISSTLGEGGKVLYVSGEESKWQLKYRAKRLNVGSDNVLVLTETDVEKVLAAADRLGPDFMIIDSIQTMFDATSASAPGSISQVRDCAMRLIGKAKADGITVLLVGHVNKEGGIAGPKVLEHMVDAVVYFEGDRQTSFRLVRASKNRYGSTGEIGVFEMTDRGLMEVKNPSEMLLDGRPKGVSGNCAACVMEGTRPLIAELQSLSTPTVFPSPRRTANGMEYNRVCLLLAVLEKRLGLRFSENDVYINVIGGLRLDEPCCDLPLALALISGIKDIPVGDDVVAFGEIGLAGEIRAVTDAELRIREADRLGFRRIVLPEGNYKKLRELKLKTTAELIPVHSLYEALKVLG